MGMVARAIASHLTELRFRTSVNINTVIEISFTRDVVNLA